MKNYGYYHVSHKVGQEDIGLGWLTGITEWMTPKATHAHPHKHSHIELIFCLKGTMTYKVAGHGSVTIHEGSGIVMPANTVHVLEGETDAPCGRLGLHMGYGRTQLFHLFKQHTGLSPNEYLVRFRIKKARDMLVCSDKSLAMIAKSAGFSSTSYFRSVFLKYEGRKPESLRDMQKPSSRT